MRIDQIIIGGATGDAITNMAIGLRQNLRVRASSDVFAEFILSETLRNDILPLDDQSPSLLVDATIYHLSYGRPSVTAHLMRRKEPIVLCYHNVTPTKFYLNYNPEFAAGLEWGRHELVLLREKVVLALADSEFNAAELRAAGYESVHVVPAGVDPYRLNGRRIDSRLIAKLHSRFPRGYVLAVGQILPHKQIEQLLESVHLANGVHGLGLGLVVAGVARQPEYLEAVKKMNRSLPFVDTWLMGSVTDDQLSTLYRQAECFLSMSSHEGLCIPPVEAMAMGLPVVARGTGAVVETVGGAGILLRESDGPAAAAEAVAMVVKDEDLAIDLRAHGLRRASEFAERNSSAHALDLVLGAIA